MNSSDEALLGRFVLTLGTVIAPVWLPWYLGQRIGLVPVWQHVAGGILFALEILTYLVASRRSVRRWEERWIEDERRRVRAERGPTLADIHRRSRTVSLHRERS